MIHLDVKQYIKGICFICSSACDSDSYLHYTCGVAYHDDKEKRIREALEKNEKR